MRLGIRLDVGKRCGGISAETSMWRFQDYSRPNNADEDLIIINGYRCRCNSTYRLITKSKEALAYIVLDLHISSLLE